MVCLKIGLQTRAHLKGIFEMVYTYKEMMDESCISPETGNYSPWLGAERHERYYSQFVSERITEMVVSHIGAETLAASRDPHFNDIPLKKWDRLPRMLNEKLVRELGGNMSLSTFTCVHKQAARLWIARNHPEIKRFKANREYRAMAGDPRHIIEDYAIGLDKVDSLANFEKLNNGQINLQIVE